MKASFIILSLLIFNSQLSTLNSQTIVSKRITASEDTYVFSNGGADNALIRQFDNPAQLKTYTHQSADTWTYRTLLKFDLSTVCNNPDIIQTCTLKIVGKENQGSFQHKISVYALSSNAWMEDELSYNNLTTIGEATKLTTVTKTVGTSDKWFDFVITDKIREYKAAGKNTISLLLMDDTNVRNPDNNSGSIVTFYSKDATGTNYPRLAVDETDISELKLSSILINGEAVDDFSTDRFNYEVDVDPAWTAVPTVSAVATDAGATVSVVQAVSLTGTVENRRATVTVLKNGLSIDYKIVFGSSVISDNALLGNIKVDGTTIEFFNRNTFNYRYYYPHTQTAQPLVSYTGTGAGQTIVYTPPADIFSANDNDRTAAINVNSPDGQSDAEYSVVFEVLPPLDLYLCIGQSNMAGRGYMDGQAGDFVPLENSCLFTPAFNFANATNPMNQYSNIRKELSVQEISPAWGFAKHLNDNYPQVKTGMIVNAKGGTAMEEWLKGQPLYDQTVARTQRALRFGTLKGILWHQGESNSSAAKVAVYPAQLAQMVSDLRGDLNVPDAFFLAGELLYSYSGAPTFNPMIRTVASFIDNSDWVSTQGLVSRGDNLHFDRAGSITLGERYAAKVIEKYYIEMGIENQILWDIFIAVENSVLMLKNIPEKMELSLFDLSGRQVLHKSISEDSSFPVEQKGVYIVSLVNEREMITRKIVVFPVLR
jgi:hypothetical protein